MVTNDQGQVAMIFYQPIPKLISFTSHEGKTSFAFQVKHGISLCWIEPAYVDRVLSITHHCCGGKVNAAFRCANELQVKVWNTGQY